MALLMGKVGEGTMGGVCGGGGVGENRNTETPWEKEENLFSLSPFDLLSNRSSVFLLLEVWAVYTASPRLQLLSVKRDRCWAPRLPGLFPLEGCGGR